MNDRELYRLMELIPEAYTEETADFLKIHSADDCMAKPATVIRKNTPGLQNNILWRILLPTGAAACLAVLVFAGIRTGLHEKPVTEASSVPEMTAVAEQTGTAPAETSRTEAAALYTEAVTQTAVRQERTAPVQYGTTAVTAAESRRPDDTEQTSAQTAAAQENSPAPTTTDAPAPQPEPRYQPGDVNMDGTVDLSDVQILYKEYVAVVIEGGESTLTPQQIALGDVYPNTKDDNLDVFRHRMLGSSRPSEGIIMTDYLISYQDFTLIMDYHTSSVAGFDLGGMNVLEYAAFLGLPPEEPEFRYAGETVIMQGDSLPKDSVTVRSYGSFPVSTERWEMTYASVKSCGDCTIMYDGKGDLAGRGFTLLASISGGKRHADMNSEQWESCTAEGGMEKRAVGDMTVYLDRHSLRTSSINEEASCYDTIALEWRNGDYLISVHTHSQEPFETYPNEILEQIIADFVAVPAN